MYTSRELPGTAEKNMLSIIIVHTHMYIYILNPPWKNLYKIDHLGVRFYRDEAGRPAFTIEWYLDCAHAVYIPKSDTKLEASQTQFSIL